MAIDDDLVQQYADAIMVLVEKDMREGLVPRDVRSFSDLHDHLDANGYVDDVAVPQPPGDYEMVNAVETRVGQMLAAGFSTRSEPTQE